MKKNIFDIKKGYCCFQIEDIVNQALTPHKRHKVNIAIAYVPKYRHFLLMDCTAITHTKNSMPSGFRMSYCPFCRAKFPKSLKKLHEKILTKEYKIKDWPYNDLDNKAIPPEFHTEEWWRKRGL